jgi:hypothetical protein
MSEINTTTQEPTTSRSLSAETPVSFDMRIFPKLYQQVFQTSTVTVHHQKTSASTSASTVTTASFDTDALLKSIQNDIKTHEQYEKFLVARYMLWKYFFKFKINFYCDACECFLNSSRYVCLECKDHFLCANCFAESIVAANTASSTSTSTNPSGEDEPKKSENTHINQNLLAQNAQHKPSHCMLLLDHICDKCDSLIIGQRHACTVCEGYDLCLMCANEMNSNLTGLLKDETTPKPEKKPDHCQEHKLKIFEPVILIARPEHITDTQVYLYLHSKIQFNILALKMADISNNESKQSVRLLDRRIVNKIITMIISSCGESIHYESNNQLKLFSLHSQENLIGLLASIINKSKARFESQKSTCTPSIELSNSKNNLKLLTGLNDEIELNQYDYLKIIFGLISQGVVLLEHIRIMLINIMKSLLIVSEPDKCDRIAREFFDSQRIDLKQLGNFSISKREFTLELLLNWIDQYLIENQNQLSENFVNVIFKLSSKSETKWPRCISNFVSYLLDVLLKLHEGPIGGNKPLVELKSKLVNFFTCLNSSKLALHCGQWMDYKNKSRYDGAGILRSVSDLKVGLMKQYYSESSFNTFYICLLDPETRKVSYLFGQKFGIDFRKSTARSKIKFVNTLNLRECHVLKMIEVLKKVCARGKLMNSSQEESVTSSFMLAQPSGCNSSKQLIAQYELLHVNKKKEFGKLYQQVSLNSNLLMTSLLTSIKYYVTQQCLEQELANSNRKDSQGKILSSLIQ